MRLYQLSSRMLLVATAASFFLVQVLTGQQLPSPMMEPRGDIYSPLLLPDTGGYFPTASEYPLLRGPANARILDGDARTQGVPGLFPYQDPVPNFYQRHPGLFRTLDQMLGVFLPRDAWTIESREMNHSRLTLDAQLGGGLPLVRNFSPDLAMVKAGPLYFDLLWVGAGAVWSDFNGSQQFMEGDGLVSYIDFGLRAHIRLTDTVYISLFSQFMYLPQSNEFAFGQGFGLQHMLGFGLDFAWSDTFGEWDLAFSDMFTGQPGFSMNLLTDANRGGFDSAGRYSFGFRQVRSNNFNDSQVARRGSAFFTNAIQFSASRLVFGGAWRFRSTLAHTDFWQTFSFRDHSYMDQLTLDLQYNGSILPFAPTFTYTAGAFNGRQPIFHSIAMGLTGRITENIDWGGNIGYLTTTGGRSSTDMITWGLSFMHNVTARTNQTLSLGQGIFIDDVVNQALTSRFLSYRLTHQFARNLSFMIFAQISDQENPIVGRRSGFDAQERAGGGAMLTYSPLDFTSMSVSVAHESSLKPNKIYDHWLYSFQIQQQLSMRLTATAGYQYEQMHGGNQSFDEHMIQFGLRRVF